MQTQYGISRYQLGKEEGMLGLSPEASACLAVAGIGLIPIMAAAIDIIVTGVPTKRALTRLATGLFVTAWASMCAPLDDGYYYTWQVVGLELLFGFLLVAHAASASDRARAYLHNQSVARKKVFDRLSAA